MPPKIKVDTAQIDDAARVFGSQVSVDVSDAVYTLAGAAAGAMAGNDQAGSSWSTAYDGAARTVMGVSADVVNGCYKLAGLLQTTAHNHSQAELNSRSRADGVPPQYLPPDYLADFVSPVTVASAAGASSNTPTGWSLVEHAVGYVWPGGHQDKLRSTGAAWGTAASSIVEAGSPIPAATAELILQESPEMDTAYVLSRSMGTHLSDLANAYLSIRDACNDYASYLDKAHSDAEKELRSLIEWTVGIEAAGAVFGFFTGGGAEVPAQAAEAGRIASTAAKIAEIIRTLITAAETVVRAIGTAVTKVIDVAKSLKALLGARLSKAAATAVSRLPGVARTAEGAAMEKLEAAVVKKTLPELFDGGKAAASEVKTWAEEQGWTESQTAGGPIKYTDENGVVRVTIKEGSPRTPGSELPHVELRGPDGGRIDPNGNPVTRKSPRNHTPISWDLPK